MDLVATVGSVHAGAKKEYSASREFISTVQCRIVHSEGNEERTIKATKLVSSDADGKCFVATDSRHRNLLFLSHMLFFQNQARRTSSDFSLDACVGSVVNTT